MIVTIDHTHTQSGHTHTQAHTKKLLQGQGEETVLGSTRSNKHPQMTVTINLHTHTHTVRTRVNSWNHFGNYDDECPSRINTDDEIEYPLSDILARYKRQYHHGDRQVGRGISQRIGPLTSSLVDIQVALLTWGDLNQTGVTDSINRCDKQGWKHKGDLHRKCYCSGASAIKINLNNSNSTHLRRGSNVVATPSQTASLALRTKSVFASVLSHTGHLININSETERT